MDFEIIAAGISFAALIIMWACAPTVPAVSEAPAKVPAPAKAAI